MKTPIVEFSSGILASNEENETTENVPFPNRQLHRGSPQLFIGATAFHHTNAFQLILAQNIGIVSTS